VKLAWLSILALLIAGLMIAGCGSGKLGSEDDPIVMSFVPSSTAPEIISRGDQIAQMIGDRTGLVVQASAAPNFVAVRDAMGKGETHIGWLDTFNYVLARQNQGVEVGMVTERMGTTSYRGQFNIRADSGINSLQDLPGRVMCWVDPSSASGYTVPRITLRANGIDPDADLQAVQAYSHRNVIAQVYNGGCDVGATYADARSLMAGDSPDVEQVVIVLATTADIPYDSISFGEDVPEEMRDQIIESLLEIAGTEEGRAVLEEFYSITGLQRAGDSIYDGFRAELSQAGVDVEDLAE
jgi:phosphonate transport system substrate-binding protein